jgi:hypothetical protein
MDLTELRNSLNADGGGGGRARPHAPPGMEGPAHGMADEIFARYRNSKQLESQHVCAILEAVLEVLKAQGSQPTPTALFAALMSSLEKPETLAHAEVRGLRCSTHPCTAASLQHTRLAHGVSFQACT